MIVVIVLRPSRFGGGGIPSQNIRVTDNGDTRVTDNGDTRVTGS